MKKSRIGILTGGGDCAGINPAIKWLVKTALDERVQRERGTQYEVLGIRDGWQGLMQTEPRETEQYVIPLNQETVRTWDRYGGTMLGTSRTNPYDPNNVQSRLKSQSIISLTQILVDRLRNANHIHTFTRQLVSHAQGVIPSDDYQCV